MSVTPVKTPPQAAPPQAAAPQQPAKGGNDHDADDSVGAVQSSPPRHVGGVVDKKA
jgi:hypothetical protein